MAAYHPFCDRSGEVFLVLLHKEEHHLCDSCRLFVLLQHEVGVVDCEEQAEQGANCAGVG